MYYWFFRFRFIFNLVVHPCSCPWSVGFCQAVHHSICLSIYLPIYISQSIYSVIYLSRMYMYPCIYLYVNVSNLFIYMCLFLSLCMHVSISLFLYRSTVTFSRQEGKGEGQSLSPRSNSLCFRRRKTPHGPALPCPSLPRSAAEEYKRRHKYSAQRQRPTFS